MTTNPEKTIRIEADALLKAFNAVKSIPDKRSTVPILAMCVVEARDGKMTIVASDLEIQATVTAECEGEFDRICVPAYLLEAGGRLTGKTVEIGAKGRDVIVKAGRTRYSGPWLPASDFPDMTPAFENSGAISGAGLSRVIRSTIGAVWVNDDRQYLRGINLESEAGQLIGTATDAHRVYNARCDAPDLALPKAIILPTKAANEALRIALANETVLVRANERMIEFSTDREKMLSKLIDGTFPDWRRLMPKETANRITVDVSEALTAMDRIIKVHEDWSSQNGTKETGRSGSGVRLVEDGDVLAIAALAGAEDAIPATFDGDVKRRGVSGRYLRDLLAVVKDRGAETIVLETADEATPFRCFTQGDDSFAAILMPYRVGAA